MKKWSISMIWTLITSITVLLMGAGCASTKSNPQPDVQDQGREPVQQEHRALPQPTARTFPGRLRKIPGALRQAHQAFQRRYYNEAVLRFREVEAEYKEHAETAADRVADCYLYIGDREKAIEAYRRALKKYRSEYADKMLKRIKDGDI